MINVDYQRGRAAVCSLAESKKNIVYAALPTIVIDNALGTIKPAAIADRGGRKYKSKVPPTILTWPTGYAGIAPRNVCNWFVSEEQP